MKESQILVDCMHRVGPGIIKLFGNLNRIILDAHIKVYQSESHGSVFFVPNYFLCTTLVE